MKESFVFERVVDIFFGPQEGQRKSISTVDYSVCSRNGMEYAELEFQIGEQKYQVVMTKEDLLNLALSVQHTDVQPEYGDYYAVLNTNTECYEQQGYNTRNREECVREFAAHLCNKGAITDSQYYGHTYNGLDDLISEFGYCVVHQYAPFPKTF